MAAIGNKRPTRRELTPGCDLTDNSWRNIYNPIWLGYNRRASWEDRAVRNTLVGGLILLIAWAFTRARPAAPPPPAPLDNNNQEDLFKNW
jgi:hypothetical protein